jgi:hypothetical protein
MASGEDEFSVDIAALERGGVNIKHLATLVSSIYGDVFNTTNEHGRTMAGDGKIAESLEPYFQSAAESLKFLKGLNDLVDTHGGKTIELGDLFGDVNNTATGEAGGNTGHRH